MRGPSSINTYIIMIIDTKYFYTIIIIYISLYNMVYIYIYILYICFIILISVFCPFVRAYKYNLYQLRDGHKRTVCYISRIPTARTSTK